jgi:hypothetical protein
VAIGGAWEVVAPLGPIHGRGLGGVAWPPTPKPPDTTKEPPLLIVAPLTELPSTVRKPPLSTVALISVPPLAVREPETPHGPNLGRLARK